MDLFQAETLKIIGITASVILFLVMFLLFVSIIATFLLFRDRGRVRRINSVMGSSALKVLLFTLDALYIPSKKIIAAFGGNDHMVDIVCTEARNMILKKRFDKTPYAKRIVILPQCLRNRDCPTRFDSVKGSQCVKCGKCKIKDITLKAEELGYIGAYIAPGSRFVKRILKSMKPEAALAVACPNEVNLAMLMITDMGIDCQGVILSAGGCVETDVELEKVFEAMERK